jgi:hypothetical protein
MSPAFIVCTRQNPVFRASLAMRSLVQHNDMRLIKEEQA